MQIPAHTLVFEIDAAYQKMVRDFRSCHLQFMGDLESIAIQWPNLDAIFRRTAFFVSPGFPAPDRDEHTLLVSALKNGVMQGLRHQGERSYRPFLLGFLDTIASAFATMRIYGVTADGNEERWQLCDEPLCHWAAAADQVVYVPVKPTEEELQACSLLLWARVLSAADLALLLASEPEETPQLSLPLGLLDSPVRHRLGSFSHR